MPAITMARSHPGRQARAAARAAARRGRPAVYPEDPDGDLPSWPEYAQTQEGIPAFHDGARLHFWNYSVEADRGSFFRVDLTPTSGAGTEADPYVLTSTRVAHATGSMPAPALTYDLTYIKDWGVVLFLPRASAKLWAIKL